MGFVLDTPDETGKPLQDARRFLQRAIELEHATIPPYLTALYSLVPGRNDEIAAVLRSVVTEEMAHMVLAANMLSAIGGRPSFTGRKFLPRYPGGLPYHIGGPGFKVPLAPFSIDLVKNVFMVIEQPEGLPLEFPIPPAPAPAPAPPGTASAPKFRTVAEFYEAILAKLEAAGPRAFTGKPAVQLTIPYGAFVVASLDDAQRAVDAIVRQGEGTKQSPLGGPAGELAHYYRFAEIVKGRTLVGDPNQPPYYYSYSGLPIPFDPTGVIPIVANPRPSMYPAGSQADRVSREFDGLYGNMLRLLERAYEGRRFEANIIGLMYQMKIMAQRLMSIQIDPATSYGATIFAAPTFEYAQVFAIL